MVLTIEKVTVDRKVLEGALDAVGRAVPKAFSLTPYASYVWVELGGDWLTLVAGWDELTIEARLPADGEMEPRLVPYLPLAQYVRAVSAPSIELEWGERLVVRAGSSSLTLNLAGTEGVPRPISAWDMDGALELSAEEFHHLAGAVYAASREEYRGAFRGVLFERGEGYLRTVGTDGYRLARFWAEVRADGFPRILVPFRTFEIKPLIRVSPVRLAVREGRLLLESGPIRVAMALMVDADFPEYERVFPAEHIRVSGLPKADVESILRRVLVMANKSTHRLDVRIEGSRLTVSAEGDYGSSTDELELTEPVSSTVALAINGKHFLEAVKNLSGERFDMVFSDDPRGPFRLIGQNSDAVLLPLRL